MLEPIRQHLVSPDDDGVKTVKQCGWNVVKRFSEAAFALSATFEAVLDARWSRVRARMLHLFVSMATVRLVHAFPDVVPFKMGVQGNAPQVQRDVPCITESAVS